MAVPLKASDEQDSLVKSLVLHTYTGALVMLFNVIVTPIVLPWAPPVLVGVIAFVLVSAPLQIGYMLLLGKRRNGELSLEGIVRYREKIPMAEGVIITLLMVVAFIILSLVGMPVSTYLSENVFSWLPNWMLNMDSRLYTGSETTLWVTFILVLMIDGILNPIVEEAYWRGCLMPRLSRLGAWAPAINGILFGLQHFWQPYNYLNIILFSMLLAYVVWWKRSIWLSIAVHCGLNTIAALITYSYLWT
jgi:membrane protease YdiL (CAAX protease family)